MKQDPKYLLFAALGGYVLGEIIAFIIFKLH